LGCGKEDGCGIRHAVDGSGVGHGMVWAWREGREKQHYTLVHAATKGVLLVHPTLLSACVIFTCLTKNSTFVLYSNVQLITIWCHCTPDQLLQYGMTPCGRHNILNMPTNEKPACSCLDQSQATKCNRTTYKQHPGDSLVRTYIEDIGWTKIGVT
jgi:hypothetical protein